MLQSQLRNNLNHVTRDRGYRFTEYRDPDLEWITQEITKSQLSVTEIAQRVDKMSKGAGHVAATTIYKWLNGETKRPQNYTLHWVGAALGFERRWERQH